MTNFEWLLENEREKVIRTLFYVGATDRKGNFTLCRDIDCRDCRFYNFWKVSDHPDVFGCIVDLIKELNSEREENVNEWQLKSNKEKAKIILACSGGVDKKGEFNAHGTLTCYDCIFYDCFQLGTPGDIWSCLKACYKWLNTEREEKEK